MSTVEFAEATRVATNPLAGLERRCLVWMADRLPRWVTSDGLTALALAAMALTGLSYAAGPRHPGALVLAIVGLGLNWFGDSLDGTLARVRRQQRPRYGFYVDHVVDCFGVLFWSAPRVAGFMTRSSRWGSVAFHASIEIYLATLVLPYSGCRSGRRSDGAPSSTGSRKPSRCSPIQRWHPGSALPIVRRGRRHRTSGFSHAGLGGAQRLSFITRSAAMTSRLLTFTAVGAMGSSFSCRPLDSFRPFSRSLSRRDTGGDRACHPVELLLSRIMDLGGSAGDGPGSYRALRPVPHRQRRDLAGGRGAGHASADRARTIALSAGERHDGRCLLGGELSGGRSRRLQKQIRPPSSCNGFPADTRACRFECTRRSRRAASRNARGLQSICPHHRVAIDGEFRGAVLFLRVDRLPEAERLRPARLARRNRGQPVCHTGRGPRDRPRTG